MNRTLYLLLAILAFSACRDEIQQTEEKGQMVFNYPEARKGDTVDIYFGKKVVDPYRWMENPESKELADWIEAENELTFGYLDNLPYRQKLEERLSNIWNYERYSAPFREGGHYFFKRNTGLQNQDVLYYMKGINGTPEVFLDPNSFSEEGTVALTSFSVSNDGKYAAYGTSSSGSDWVTLKVMEVESKRMTRDSIAWIKFGGAIWYKDGFFYSKYPEPEEGQEYAAQSRDQKIFYHRLGTPQGEDVLVYEDLENPLYYNWADVSDDERFLFISSAEGTSGNTFYFKDLENGMDSELVPVVTEFGNDHYVLDVVNGQFLVMTNLQAQNYRLVRINPESPEPDNWEDVLPNQASRVLTSASVAGGKILATYMEDANDHVYVYDLNGQDEMELELPAIGSVGGFQGKDEDTVIFYSFTSFNYPPTIFKYEIETNNSTVWKQPKVDFNPKDYETKQVFYKSKDGTQVPMFLVHKKGLELNGQNPTYMYGYGGFNISLTPTFNSSRVVFLENGGIYAQPSLRGGGEYGEAWHEAGMLLDKQNVFDDFIAAAEFLIEQKYTNADKLAISGRSNGGLLVGATMVQRPELFEVALPGVGVMDMLRYHKFTVGHGWVVEYGSSEDSVHFENLVKYSPLHNLKDDVTYPTTLITTADHDDRVVPAHSFKFAATLQEKHGGENPVLIRIDTKAGHGAGKPTSMQIEEAADVMAFVFKHLGMEMEN